MRPTGLRGLVAVAGALAVAGTSVAMAAGPATEPTVDAPSKVRPGKVVRLELAGFPPRSRVRVQFGRHYRTPCNCDASLVIPRLGKPGFRVNRDGGAVLRVRMPRRYARCVGVKCGSPNFARFKSGQRVYAAAWARSPYAFAKDLARVK